MRPIFSPGDVVLFQGDNLAISQPIKAFPEDSAISPTERDSMEYAMDFSHIAASLFGATYPELDVIFENRSLAGNSTYDLLGRWQEDCVDLHPDWISILVGIHDTRCRFDNDMFITAQEFEANYRRILEQVRLHTKASLILCEPFLLPISKSQNTWREDLDEKIHAIRSLAREYGAIYVPFDGIFAQAACRQEPRYWAADGIHPTLAGQGLMAKAWLDAVITH